MSDIRTMRALAVASAAEQGTRDALTGRLPEATMADIWSYEASRLAARCAERAGHSPQSRHPDTYGQCPIIDDARADIVGAYAAAYGEALR